MNVADVVLSVAVAFWLAGFVFLIRTGFRIRHVVRELERLLKGQETN